MLAMHMANELLSPGVAATCIAVSGVCLALAARAAQRDLDPARVPLMGVLGAFVFAAQMINFPILSGTSGHLVGSLLLAVVLGPSAATLVMTSILIVQCLIFQDGGILALGANILNMGILPCYAGFGVFRLVAGRSPSSGRLFAALFLASILGLSAGAALVPVETRLSGVLAVSFARFLLLMIALHLIVATVEAFITFAVVIYLVRIRPGVLERSGIVVHGDARPLRPGAIGGSIFIAALLLAGVGSLFASQYPDALDSLTGGRPEHTMVKPVESAPIQAATHFQEKTAPLAEYAVPGHEAWWSTSVSGIVGTLITLGVVWLVGKRLRAAPAPVPVDHPHA